VSDVLVVTAFVPGAYPSVNAVGRDSFRGGRKSPEYVDLFAAVRDAAEAETARIGWVCAEYPCDVSVTFYHRDKRRRDCSNLAKTELDALTAAGVWVDDTLARAVHLDIEYDPAGESRVVIVVRRKFAVHVAQVSPLLAKARRTRGRSPESELVHAEAPKPPGRVAYINGKPVPREQALAEIRGGKLR